MLPDYQSIMLPLLKIVADEQEHTIRDLIESLASIFDVKEDERKMLLSSGNQPIFDNRVGWAKTYLKKAGLLESPRRGTFRISSVGRDVLAEKPARIDARYLRRFPSFVEFQNPSRSESEADDSLIEASAEQTPEEVFDRAYQGLRGTLVSELLSSVLEMSPAFFEKLVVDLLVRMGYGGSIKDAGNAIGKSGDEGIDGTIKEDKLGLDIIYLQAKRWAPGNLVGRPEIQKFVGALAGQGAKKGVFITTSSFTKDALEYAPRNETKIVLIDGEKLANLMIDYGIGCNAVQTYEIKKIDSDYFGE